MRARIPVALILLSLGLVALWPVSLDKVSEQARVSAHLGRVLEDMAGSPPEGLTAAQRSARAETMTWLEEYRNAGRFPHNHVLSVRTPVFVDPHGTPCAVGYLMLRSGEHDFVEEISRESNLARVPDLADDPRLVAWLASRGITTEEAAMIQPWYGPVREYTSYRDETVGLAVGTAAILTLAELTEPPEDGFDWLAWAPLGTMVGNLVLLNALDNENDQVLMPDPIVEMVVSGVGAVASLVVAARRFDRPPPPQAEPTATLIPLVDPWDRRVGLAVTVRR